MKNLLSLRLENSVLSAVDDQAWTRREASAADYSCIYSLASCMKLNVFGGYGRSNLISPGK